MPIIDIPDTLAFTKLEALKALEVEVNRQQQDARKRLVETLRATAAQISSPTITPDDEIGPAVLALRDQIVALRQEFVRLGRVEADFRQQWTAAGGV